MTPPRPPRGWPVVWLLRPDERELVVGDLVEEWPERVASQGVLGARLWFWKMLTRSCWSAWTGGGRMGIGWTTRFRGALGLSEVAYEFKALARAPLWTGLAVGTVVTGVLFSVVVAALVHAVRAELVPYPEADRLLHLVESNGRISGVADPTFRRLSDRTDAFEAVAAWGGIFDMNLNRDGAEPSVAGVATASSGAFDLLGYEPLVGRAFSGEDEVDGGARSALASFGFWQREFGGSQDILGSPLRLNGSLHRIVGVMPAGARLPSTGAGRASADLWVTTVLSEAMRQDPGIRYQVLLLPRPGITVEAARSVASQVLEGLRRELPQWRTDPSWHMAVVPLREQMEGPAPAALRSLAAAAALLLVLVGTNLMALTLSRLQRREREFGLHSALGAPPGIATRRLVIQNLWVGTVAAVVGGGAAMWVLSLIRTARPAWIPGAQFAGLGVGTLVVGLGVALALCLVAAAAAGGIRGRFGAGRSLALRERGPGLRWKVVGRALVVVETGMVVSLVVGAGLILRSLVNLAGVDPAAVLEDRVAVQVALPTARYGDSESVRRFTGEVLELTRAILPGVEVAASTGRPLSQQSWNFVVLDGVDAADGELPTAELEEVTPGYFDALGIPLVAGRAFREADFGEGAEPVVVVNQALASLFGEAAAVDRTIRFDEGPGLRIVGVIRGTPAGRLEGPPPPRVYLPDMDLAFPWVVRSRWFVLHAPGGPGPAGVREALATAVREVDSEVPVRSAVRLTELRGDLLAEARFRSLMFGLLGAVALVLGVAGIFGVVSHMVGSTRRETGIRLALGATRGSVFGRTLAIEGAVVLLGAAAGLVAAWQLGGVLSSVLFGVASVDLPTYAVALLGVGVAAGLAIAIPAYRAATCDPLESLRAE